MAWGKSGNVDVMSRLRLGWSCSPGLSSQKNVSEPVLAEAAAVLVEEDQRGETGGADRVALRDGPSSVLPTASSGSVIPRTASPSDI